MFDVIEYDNDSTAGMGGAARASDSVVVRNFSHSGSSVLKLLEANGVPTEFSFL